MNSCRASIDIGSNSVLLFIGEIRNEYLHEILDHAEVTGLGRGIDKTKLFSDVAMEETCKALRKYHQLVLENNIKPEDVIVTATEASRVVKNSKEFFKKIERELQFSVKTITGEGEAYYSALGVSLSCDKSAELTIMDIGGASTELIMAKNNPFKIDQSKSLPIGAVRSTDWLGNMEFNDRFKAIEKDVNFIDYQNEKNEITAIAGTMTTIAAVIKNLNKFDKESIHNLILDIDELTNLERNWRKLSPDEILEKHPIVGKRSKNIYGGLYAALKILKLLKTKKIKISTYGLRQGTCFVGEIDQKFT